MSEDLHNIDDLFRKALNEYGEDPPETTWEAIDGKLDKQSVIKISAKYKRLKWAAVVILVFAGSMAMYSIYTKNINKQLVKANNIGKTLQENRRENKYINKSQDKVISDKDSNNATLTNKPLTNFSISQPDYIVSKKNETIGNTLYSVKKPALQNVLVKHSGTSIYKNNGEITSYKHPETDTLEDDYSTRGSSTDFVTNRDNDNQVFNTPPASLISVSSGEKEINTIRESTLPGSLIDKMNPSAVKAILLDSLRVATFGGMDLSNFKVQPLLKPSHKKDESNNLLKRPGVQGKSLSATVFFSPNFISSRVQQDKRMFREDDRSEIKQKEKAGFSYSVGALLEYIFKSGWSIQTGVGLSTAIQIIEAKNIYARPDNNGNVRYRINCSAGYSYINIKSGSSLSSGDSLKAFQSKTILKYINIPFTLKYHFLYGKLTLAPGAGLSVNILSKGRIETTVANGASKESQVLNDIVGLKSSYLHSALSVDVQYRLNADLSLTLSPVYRFALNSVNENGPVKSYQNSFGVGTALNLKL